MPRHERRVIQPDAGNYRSAIPHNFRVIRGWTQAELAEWYGVSVRTWQRYESQGAPRPLLKRIETWARTTTTGADNSFYLSFTP